MISSQQAEPMRQNSFLEGEDKLGFRAQVTQEGATSDHLAMWAEDGVGGESDTD